MSTPPLIPDHALIGLAKGIPTTPTTPILSLSPLILQIPQRPVPLQLKITIPTTGSLLPIILLSHGQGSSNNLSSMNGYGPLVTFYASHGFAVIQPTHLSSKTLKLSSQDLERGIPKSKSGEGPLFWKSRVQDFKDILDRKEEIEEGFEAARGRLDWDSVGVVGHSMGAHTASILLGAQSKNAHETIDMKEPRIRAGVLIGAPGCDPGGHTQTAMAREVAPFFADTSFEEMESPALVVYGDEDVPDYLTTRGLEWHRDPYVLGGGKKDLLTVRGAGHCFGGVSGWDAKECVDESVERCEVVRRMTAAYLRSQLGHGYGAWNDACEALEKLEGVGMVERK
ncbi:Alpha/Beta hydrolase protein [Rhexocercosporidium sp. MPI-PUGE-AT-0058]|nr:Alpha/Beta hydrolase protein [Rhexocercosporidium sp. MPI-PUGE-AT-0058]